MDVNNEKYWTEFISLYRELECLWNAKSEDYLNKNKRQTSYQILLDKFREFNKVATVDIMKKKINNMRTSFRRELKKVQAAKHSGTKYEPNLWYYDLLAFIAQSNKRKTDTTLHNLNKLEDDCEDFEENTLEEYDEEFIDVPSSPISFTDNKITTPQLSRSPSPAYTFNSTSNLRKPTDTLDKNKRVLDLSEVPLPNDDDDYYVIAGKRIGCQLKSLSEHQRIVAEKLISDVIFYGRLGRLTEESSIVFNVAYNNSNFYPQTTQSFNVTQVKTIQE